MQIAQTFGSYFEKLVEMLSRIGDVLPRFQAYMKLFPTHERLRQALCDVYLDVIEFCTDAKSTFIKARKSSSMAVLFVIYADYSYFVRS